MASRTDEEIRIPLRDDREALNVLGRGDEHARAIEAAFHAEIHVRGSELILRGAGAGEAASLVRDLITASRAGRDLSAEEVLHATRLARQGAAGVLGEPGESLLTPSGKPIAPRTRGQRSYVEAIRSHDLVLSIGPAGTGKTYLAVAMAVVALRAHTVQRIVLTRPAVEAGERLGFLPGDLQEKVDPYLRPLYDALFEMIGPDRFRRLSEKGMIEVAPLAYMRGRTLNDAFIILDEAQNTTPEQMKMALTRMGFGSRMVVTGDITQIDLPRERTSGLVQALEVFRDVAGIAIVRLTETDVVRHELVQQIVRAYDRHEAQRAD